MKFNHYGVVVYFHNIKSLMLYYMYSMFFLSIKMNRFINIIIVNKFVILFFYYYFDVPTKHNFQTIIYIELPRCVT